VGNLGGQSRDDECAFGFEPYADVGDVFEDAHELLAAPFFFTINMILRFHPDGKSFGEFLNMIETAYEAAWLLDFNLLPARMVRARMQQEQQAPGSTAEGQ
jgi:hypothetical protein